MAEENPFVSNLLKLLQLPAFQELEEIELLPEEKAEIDKETKEMLVKFFLDLPAFQNLQKLQE